MASQFPGDHPEPITPPPHRTGPGSVGMVERVRNIILTPKAEWPRIDAEPATERGLFMAYAVPLAAIGPLAGLIGALLFPTRVFGVVILVSPVTAVANAIVGYATALAGVWLMARIVDALAPSFNGQKSLLNATKLVIFAAIPSWLGGIGALIPGLGGLLALIGGLYALYLLYLGLPVLMKTPADKAIPYIAVVAVIGVVLTLALIMVAGALAALFAPATIGTVTIS